MPLKGVKIIELAGLAPAPFCGMLLADFGATVIRVDKANASADMDCLRNGKRSLAVNLKSPKGVEIMRKLCSKSDVIIEPFRKGVMEKLGLGPDVLLTDNPRLIYARLTGFGQTGSLSTKAGHDINFIALSGLLSFFGRKSENPLPPCNIVADFGGGGLLCAFGILLALFERSRSGKGQVIDSAMVDGAAYLGSWLFRSQHLPIWGNPRGCNVLDSGSHFYETYKTKDNKYVAVGALESEFYDQFIRKLNDSELDTQFGDFEKKKERLANIFATKTQDEWCSVFEDCDACFTPVLDPGNVASHPHNRERGNFVQLTYGTVPKPAPVLSRTPGQTKADYSPPDNGSDTEQILMELGYGRDEIMKMADDNVIGVAGSHNKTFPVPLGIVQQTNVDC